MYNKRKQQKQISNQVQRYHCFHKKHTNKLPTRSGGLSENCSRLHSPCRRHGDSQGYFAALGDELAQMKDITSHIVGGWNRASEQRSFSVCFVPLIIWRTFVCVRFLTQTQVVANGCALQQYVFGLESSARWHAQYQLVERTHTHRI